jgi:hypothetical protein
MFITNFSLYLHSQNFYLIILAVIGVVLLLSLVSLALKKELENLVLSFFIFLMFLTILFPALKPNEYKLTIAYVNVNDNHETMTKDVAINTLLNDGIYPKYNAKYKTEKETFKLTKEEYGKLSKIYYDDLNNRR